MDVIFFLLILALAVHSINNKIKLEKFLIYVMIATVLYTFICKYHGINRYEQINRDEVFTFLKKSHHRDLEIYRNLSECSYDYIKSDVVVNKHDFVYDKYGVDVTNGGNYPKDCRTLFDAAILVTYRNRSAQLDIFVKHIHTFLKKQNIYYRIYVIEQCDTSPWNKGALYNIGAMKAIEDGFRCLILHDVDLLPLSIANIYACSMLPRHLSASIDKFRFVLPYEELAGGVLSITTEQYLRVNGLSNRFHFWGGEDDDFHNRLLSQNLTMIRFPNEMSRYTMLRHRQENRNCDRRNIMAENKGHYLNEGFNNVKWSEMKISLKPFYKHICVKFSDIPARVC